MHLNKTVLFSAVYIGIVSGFQAVVANKGVSRIMIGTYVFLLVLSVLDFFGGPASQIASGLALVAVVYVTLTQFPWQSLLQAVGVKK